MKKILMPLMAMVTVLSCTSANAEGALPMTDFNDGKTQGWGKGGAATNPVTVEFEESNGFLKFISNGPDAADDTDKRVVFHSGDNKWRGNYNAMGVKSISVRMKNVGSTDLEMHAAYGNTLADLRTRYVTKGIMLPNDGEWHDLAFSLTNDLHMVAIGGHGRSSASFSPEETLGNVAQIRFTHGTIGQDDGDGPFEGWNRGPELKAELWVDDIALSTEEVAAQ